MNTKASHIYGWEDGPVEERPSDFNSSSGFLAGSDRQPSSTESKRTGLQRTSGWLTTVVFIASMAALVGMWALVGLIRLFKH